MYTPNLEDLYLTEDELEIARAEVKEMAFRDWEQAGRPNNCDQEFWEKAQLEWIEYRYVPDRYVSEDALCDPLTELV